MTQTVTVTFQTVHDAIRQHTLETMDHLAYYTNDPSMYSTEQLAKLCELLSTIPTDAIDITPTSICITVDAASLAHCDPDLLSSKLDTALEIYQTRYSANPLNHSLSSSSAAS